MKILLTFLLTAWLSWNLGNLVWLFTRPGRATWRDPSSVMAFLLLLDHVLNILTGGSPRHTISGRTGHFALFYTWPVTAKAVQLRVRTWRLCQRVIDWAFAPVETGSHCHRVCVAETEREGDKGFQRGTRFLLLVLAIGCCALAPLIRCVTQLKAGGR